MSTQNETKLNQLLALQPKDSVLLSSWLVDQGYSLDLQKRYKKSLWFESIGSGALIRKSDSVDYLGAVYALQAQLGSSVHPGGKTALALQEKSHYLELSIQKVQLFCGQQEHLPLWFKKRDWGLSLDCQKTNFLPPDLGLLDFSHKSFQLKVSSSARAVMECLYLAPKHQPLVEVYELMEGLNNLRPTSVQTLLEACNSVKVKRLFLYMAEKAGHEWFAYLDLSKIDLGSGKRSLVKNGVYAANYQITVSEELANLNDGSDK
jgi:hypothetical protein